MRILYFSPRNIWPLNGGAPIRDYYLSRELAHLGPVYFFGLRHCRDHSSPPPDLHFAGIHLANKGRNYTPWKLLRGMIGPVPLTSLNYFDVTVAAELEQTLRQHAFDVVQIEGIHLAQYLPILRSAPSHPALICDWHDIESELMSRYSLYTSSWLRQVYARRTVRLLHNAERSLLARCDAHTAVSERERASLHRLWPQAQVHVVENGVDVDYFARVAAERKAQATSAGNRRDLVFVGSMDFHANIDGAKWLVQEVWPKIRALKLPLRLLLIGARPVSEVLSLNNPPDIVVTGTVDDVRPYYRDALAAIVPLRIGGGTRLKILEAMAAGVPVVSTQIGIEGLRLEPGKHLMLADTPERMAGVLRQLHDSVATQHGLSEAGCELVRSDYDWPVIGRSLRAVYQSICQDHVHA